MLSLCIRKHDAVQSGQPVLCGHIFLKIAEKMSFRNIMRWASSENAKNGFPKISFSRILKLRRIYKDRHTGRNFIKFEKMCDEVAHCETLATLKETPATPKETPTTSMQTQETPLMLVVILLPLHVFPKSNKSSTCDNSNQKHQSIIQCHIFMTLSEDFKS